MLEAIETAEAQGAVAFDEERGPMSRDLALPALPVNYVPALNAYYRHRPSLQFRFAGRGMRLAPTWLADEPEIFEPYTVSFKVDGDQGELVVSRGILDFLLLELDPALSLERLDPEKAALVVEHALTEPLSMLEATIGCQLSVITVSKGAGRWTGPDRPNLPMVLYVERMGIAWSVLRLAAGDVLRLCRFLDANAGSGRRTLDVPLPCRLRVAAATMALDELRSLQPGDIILPDEVAGDAGDAVAVIAEHLAAPVEHIGNGWRVSGRPRKARGSSREWSLAGHRPRANSAQDGALDELPVRVMFEAGGMELDLPAVQKLTSGSVLPLARPAGDALDIVVGGRGIGRGSLVRIGDSIGVRVTRLFGRSV
jgi:type III secretion protein Q